MNQIEYSTPGSRALASIRTEWRTSFGSVILAIIISLFVSPIWIPLADLAIAFLLLFFASSPNSPNHPCGRLNKITSFCLIITATISFLINIAFKTSLIHLFFDHASLNDSIPFITSLIVFPVLTVVCAISSTRFFSSRHDSECNLINEYSPDQPFFGNVIHGVYRSMLKFLSLVAGVVTVIDWGYYLLFYRNVNLNSPDRFFFFVVPTAIFVGSIFYVRTRFGTVVLRTGKDAFSAALGVVRPHDRTILRFLVIKDNKLLLDVSNETLQNMNIDTPVVEYSRLTSEIPLETARARFSSISHISDFFIKLLYRSEQSQLNNVIYHYLVNIPEDAGIGNLQGDWTSLDWIDRYMKMGVLSSELATEIHRFYTISMAWKTYTNDGRRRYPIKNYRPSFRLDDAKDWDVDYQDPTWLKVARLNEDSKLWTLKQIFSRRNRKSSING